MLKLTALLTFPLLFVGALISPPAADAVNVAPPVLRATAVLPPSPSKRALLIGISNYCPAGATPEDCKAGGKYWWNLNSAPDVEALKNSLMTRFGFQANDIKVLTTKEETTHKNIVSTFKSFLIDQTKAGDIVYFHYSGHGGQVPDDKQNGPNPIVGDEIDGLDESLIPSDYKTQQDGSNNIRDDEIGELLARLKAKQPDSITMTMDSCFSGSNTRGGEHLVRGKEWDGPKPQVNTRAPEGSSSGLLTRGAAAQQGYVIISATNDRQVAGETTCNGKEMGLFTCALVKAFDEAVENTTYRDLFEKVNDQVLRNGRNQSPQLEGVRDQRVMKLGAAPPQPYVTIETLGSRIILKAGSLQGMTAGSHFDIHPKGADPKNTKAFAQAEISRVELTTSVLSLTSPGPPPKTEDLQLARAVETLHNFGDRRLRVRADDLVRAQNGTKALQALSDLRMVNTTPMAGEVTQVRICRGRCADELRDAASSAASVPETTLTLMREDGSIIKRLQDNSNLGEEIRNALEAEARWRYVKEVLRNDDRYINLKFRLVPVSVPNPPKCNPEADPNCNLTEDKPLPVVAEGGQPVLLGGDYVQLEFLNTGTFPVYVTVLDLRSDGTIGPLFPHPCVALGNASENLIPVSSDGTWHRIPWQFTTEITPPYGPEMFKVIATRDPADFSALIDPPTAGRIARGGAMRGNERGAVASNPDVAKMLVGAAAPRLTRGDPPFINYAAMSARPMNWATVELGFEARQGAKTDFKPPASCP
jgi:hypothetical protein